MRPKPLDGLRILDLTRLLPGPLATQHLADLGAEVIKIEDTGAGDYARTLGPGAEHAEGAWLFRLCNRNKRGLRLDLKQAAGRELLQQLATTADVLVEGFRPGVMQRLGVGYEQLRELNPKLVYCAISGYGQTGPYRDLAGHDLNYIGYSGVLAATGPQDGTPSIPALQIGDLLGGSLNAVMGILAAVYDAQARGQGRMVDVSMTDGVLAHALFPLIGHLSGMGQRGADLLTGRYPCYAVYRTADDQYMAVGALEPKFWAECCHLLEHPEWIARQFEPQLIDEVAAVFAQAPRATWETRFATADCCVTPVLSSGEALEHPLFQARGMLLNTADGPRLGLPLQLSEFELSLTPPPAAGQHSVQILQELGLSTEQIAQLQQQGVI